MEHLDHRVMDRLVATDATNIPEPTDRTDINANELASPAGPSSDITSDVFTFDPGHPSGFRIEHDKPQARQEVSWMDCDEDAERFCGAV